MNLFRAALHALALGVSAGPAVVAVASVAGFGHRWPDLLAQFGAPVLMASVVLLVPLLWLRLWPAAGVAGLAVVGLLVALAPEWWPERGVAADGAPTLSLYSANVLWKNGDTEAIARSIAEADADVVILIELGDGPSAAIDILLPDHPHRITSPRAGRSGKAARSVVASRFPLTGIKDRRDGLHSVGATVEGPFGTVHLLGVHLTRPWPFQYQWGQINQVSAISEIRDDLTGPTLVAGDFNAVSGARIGRQVQTEAGLIPAPGFPGTWPTAVPVITGITIDQVYRSPDLALVERRLGRANGSDHRPVITRFALAR